MVKVGKCCHGILIFWKYSSKELKHTDVVPRHKISACELLTEQCIVGRLVGDTEFKRYVCRQKKPADGKVLII